MRFTKAEIDAAIGSPLEWECLDNRLGSGIVARREGAMIDDPVTGSVTGTACQNPARDTEGRPSLSGDAPTGLRGLRKRAGQPPLPADQNGQLILR